MLAKVFFVAYSAKTLNAMSIFLGPRPLNYHNYMSPLKIAVIGELYSAVKRRDKNERSSASHSSTIQFPDLLLQICIA